MQRLVKLDVNRSARVETSGSERRQGDLPLLLRHVEVEFAENADLMDEKR